MSDRKEIKVAHWTAGWPIDMCISHRAPMVDEDSCSAYLAYGDLADHMGLADCVVSLGRVVFDEFSEGLDA